MWIGRASVSTTAWSLVEKPPREWPRALHRTPLFRPTHLGVRGLRTRRRLSRSHRPRAVARERSLPSVPSAPSSRSGCRRSSRDRIARVDRATANLSSHGKSPLRRRAGRRVTPLALTSVAVKKEAVEPTEHLSVRDGACRSLITPEIGTQLPSAPISQVIEMIYFSDRPN